MKILIWSLCALLALLWTGASWAVAAALAWAAQQVSQTGAGDVAAMVGSWSLPSWLVAWFDLAWLSTVQLALVQLVDAAQAWWPGIGQVMGWVQPLVWMVWAGVMVVLVLLAVLAHVLVGQFAGNSKPPSPQARAGAL